MAARSRPGTWIKSLADLPPARAVLLDVTPRQLAGDGRDRLPAGYRRAHEPVPLRAGRVQGGLGARRPRSLAERGVPADGHHPRRRHHRGGRAQRGRGHRRRASGAAVLPGDAAGVVDPSRRPAGKHVLWAYCHVPPGSDIDMADRIEAQIERFAPGFRDLILARSVMTYAINQCRHSLEVYSFASKYTIMHEHAKPVSALHFSSI